MPKKTCENICNICGKPFYAGYQEDYDYCEQCRILKEVKIEELGDYKPEELLDYYDNAKRYANANSDEEKMYRQQITMVAIARLYEMTYGKDPTFDNLDNDVAEIRKKIDRLKAKRNNLPVETKIVYKCITCGNQIKESFLCPSCQKKYKNKDVLIKITNGEKAEILDESYEGRYVCKDGHIVKSKSEREIDDYLYDHNIIHA